jgi:hypothetical protein
MAPLLDLITTAESFHAAEPSSKDSGHSIIVKVLSIGHRLVVSQWDYKLWGLEHGGFVNATAWDPSSPALRALNASEAVSHRNTTQASPILQ